MSAVSTLFHLETTLVWRPGFGQTSVIENLCQKDYDSLPFLIGVDCHLHACFVHLVGTEGGRPQDICFSARAMTAFFLVSLMLAFFICAPPVGSEMHLSSFNLGEAEAIFLWGPASC